MDCPKCQRGQIRVMTLAACGCGHHGLVCAECLAFFTVECGDPYGPGKLPPAYPMKFDLELTHIYRIMRQESETAPEGPPAQNFYECPLLEDFRTSLQEKR